MKLIVGLGNPGAMYAQTRHNLGFEAIDGLTEFFNAHLDKKGFKGAYTILKFIDQEIILLKPQTYMNLSGQSVAEIARFYKIPTEDILVIYDDLALETGKIRLRKAGTSGSHNGMQSVLESLGSRDIKRLRIGIGYMPENAVGADYVLSKFPPEQLPLVKTSIQKAVEAVVDYLKQGFDHAMNYYN